MRNELLRQAQDQLEESEKPTMPSDVKKYEEKEVIEREDSSASRDIITIQKAKIAALQSELEDSIKKMNLMEIQLED